MIIVDTHCHAGRSWFEPIELLRFQMDSNRVEKAVLIQHGGSYDNTYLLECARGSPGRFAVVVIVDTSRPDAPSTLEDWAQLGAGGVRLDPTARSPGPDPLAIWRKAADLGLVVSCQGDTEDFASDGFKGLVAEFSTLPIVIEHLAGAKGGEQPPYAAFREALATSRRPNTYIKIPGLGEISERPPVLGPEFAFDYTPPLIEIVYEEFGPSRMMWGSDYPPVSFREGYRNALQGVITHPALSGDEDRDWVMGKTALSVFDFDRAGEAQPRT